MAQPPRLEVASGEFALVADAGSTATKVYLFHVKDGALNITKLGKGPALSSFRHRPEHAADALRDQLRKARGAIPEALHPTVSMSVLATAGMRSLDRREADAVYRGLRSGLEGGGFAFNRSALRIRTISGREEGFFAVIAANYLAKRVAMSLEVVDEGLMGVLDLGGASTQIAVPPPLQVGDSLASTLTGDEQMYIHSYASLGAESVRQRTFRSLVRPLREVSAKGIQNPCAFAGQTDPDEGWYGTGDAAACQAYIVPILAAEKAACPSSAPPVNGSADCLPSQLPNALASALSAGSPRLLLISGFHYAVDFARWWLARVGKAAQIGSFERPTIADLRAAAASLCVEKWADLSSVAQSAATGHRYTPAAKVPHRCFELSYVVALLSVGYGLPDDVRAFRVLDEIAGSKVEWTLGAFLYSRALLPSHRG